ncbi:hypothetical protein PRK78_004794 [Emydomyces testavorans]|uniref:Uncharacterized protein n=1 Tax=Emydomyces testavorans TaxID=2070801 RepID=A0AAF0IM11_9EURO|nr:hypothetical protein PRK78_004794 [Emydomyces testavorans]
MPESASVSHFSLPLPLWQQPLSYRTAKYDPPKRAKRHVPEDTDVSDLETGSDSKSDEDIKAVSAAVSERGSRTNSVKSERSSSHPSTSARSSVLLTPDEAHQYRIAGHPLDTELPGGSFPHSDCALRGKERITKKHIENDLAQLNPPVFLHGSARNSLRLRHLGVITTILHRCLLEGDYVRAGRAWGLILRDEWGGHAIDVRTEGRWGIGAEILLWRDKQTSRSGEGDNGSEGSKTEWFSRAGFEKAKQYYERLILHYPYRKHAPNALGPLDFYPAMFGLWISVVQEESRAAREAGIDNEKGEDERYGYGCDVEENMSISSDLAQEERRRAEIAAQARTKELEEAQRIASQLDDLLVSPPFSDSYELLRLRGMVSLWVGDLFVSSVSPDEAAEQGLGTGRDGDGDITMMSYDDRVDSILARMEEGLGMERKMAEVQKGREYFQRAKARKVGPLSAMDRSYMDMQS